MATSLDEQNLKWAESALIGPIALDSRNFTSIKRTPWAGSALAAGIKSKQCSSSTIRVGESWEMSCDPDAPSKLAGNPAVTLSELIARYPEHCLSASLVASGRTTCDILVKLLNADSPLSLQIHPSDNHPALKSNECGKPESWLVLSAKPGSGFYLGFSRAWTTAEIKRKLDDGQFDESMLQFVPVQPGDYFEIEPHVPHAIGPGVVLLEPQRISAGKSGKTWRMWDWNRKYDQNGDLDPIHGKPRELHIRESMTLLTPESQHGQKYVDQLRRKPSTLTPSTGVVIDAYPPNSWYQTISIKLAPNAKIKLNSLIGYGCLTVLRGLLQTGLHTQKPIIMQQGETFFLPASCLPIEMTNNDQEAHLTLVIPAGQGVSRSPSLDLSEIFL